MIPFEPPTIRVWQALAASCAGMQDNDLKARLLAREHDLSTAEKMYIEAAERNTLSTFALDTKAAELKSKDPDGALLKDLYTSGLVGRTKGRAIYDQLKARHPYRRCLLCGHGEITSLDHHLPKASFPLHTVCPVNLVPACSRCNQAKGDRIGNTGGERTLHPYYDRPGSAGRYLFATVDQWPVQFHVRPLPTWSTELTERVEHHFTVFKLTQRYSEFSVPMVAGFRWIHRQIKNKNGAQALTAHLLEDATEHVSTHGLNAWETALRYGLAASSWYLEDGLQGTL